MNQNLLFLQEDGSIKTEVRPIELPTQCGYCHQTGPQIVITGVGTNQYTEQGYDAYLLSGCPKCRSITVHFLVKGSLLNDPYTIEKSVPEPEILSITSKEIKTVFPNFVKIYEQASKAEFENLNLLAGMGYRKAIEFLITGYLDKYAASPEVTHDWLYSPKITLKAKIDKIPNERIKSLALAIAYIGNDETHVTRQNPDYDIRSMKVFIRALISEIENEISYNEASRLINP